MSQKQDQQIKFLVGKMGKKFGDTEVVKLSLVALTNLLAKKGIITDEEYKTQIVNELKNNADKLLD